MSELTHLEAVLAQSTDPDNPGAEEIRELSDTTKTVAVVGISRNPEKAARKVPAYMASRGYEIIPVNPFVDKILGRDVRPSLADVTEELDMVLVFRPSEEAALVLGAAVIRPERPAVWLQEGIRADEGARAARDGGFTVVQDLCFYKAHQALLADVEG